MPVQKSSGESRLRRWDFVCAIQCLVVSTIGLYLFAYARGQDINYDLMNYHRFSPFAFFSTDPFQNITIQQQFLNPILYIPHYGFNFLFSPKVATFFIVLLQSLNVPLIYLLSSCLLLKYDAPWKIRSALSLCAAAIAISSSSFLSEIGTSFADSITSLFVIGGICLVVLSFHYPDHQMVVMMITAGICLGSAFGLKLTNGVFVVAAGASLVFAGELRRRVPRLVTLIMGGAIGFLVTGGYWHFTLYKKFGNPIFPFFNSIFKSPFYPPVSLIDERFIPSSVLDAVAYPFRLAVGLNPEYPSRDIRFALLFISVLILCLIGVLRYASWRADMPRTQAAIATRHGATFLVLFSVISFALWIRLFAIQRYLVPLELMAGVSLIAIGVIGKLGTRAMIVAGVLTTLAVCAWSRPYDQGHSQWVDRIARTDLPKDILDSNGLFLLYGWPTTYLIPDFGKQARFFDVYMLEDPNNATGRAFNNILATEKRPMYSIQGEPLLSVHSLKFLNNFGLRQDGIDCVHFASFIGAQRVRLALCPVYRGDTGAPTSASTYPIGRTLIFGRSDRNSNFYEFSGWGIEFDVGRAWDPSAKELHLRLEIMQQPPEKLALNFSLVVPPGQCNFDVTINGTNVFEARSAENCNDGKFDIALPTGVVGLDRLLDIAFVRFASPSSASEPIVI